MKTRFPRILGVFAAIFMVASFVIPTSIAAPAAVSADPGIMRWDTVMTPEAFPLKNDVDNTYISTLANNPPGGDGTNNPRGSETISMAVGNDGQTIAWITRDWGYSMAQFRPGYLNSLLWSNTSGITAVGSKELGLIRAPGFVLGLTAPLVYPFDLGNGLPSNCYQVALAPDDPKFIAVTCDPTLGGLFNTGLGAGPKRIYVSSDSGNTWDQAYDGTTLLAGTEFIRNIDISIDYGGKRDIGFVTATGGTGSGRWFVRASSGFNNWIDQTASPSVAIPVGLLTSGAADPTVTKDYYAIKFSPTYNGDSSVALVFATDAANAALNGGGTYYNVATRDLNQNYTTGWAFNNSINVRNSALATDSPHIFNLNNVSMQLPSDFSGQSSSLRRAYISLDAMNGPVGGAVGVKLTQDGIYRIDDTTIYVLMDTSSQNFKSIYTIAYFGTYASGKLLAGERLGFPCTATVPTWFTDSPTTCPIPCWYPALKPTTGAAGLVANCLVGNNTGVGAAIVGWNADGSLGLVVTGSLPANPTIGTVLAYAPAAIPGIAHGVWWGAMSLLSDLSGVSFYELSGPGPAVSTPWGTWLVIHDDESAFAISRNNGETWNQLSIIDTTIDWFNDVAVAPDCTTIYLASVNANNAGIGCNEFDSVWRATINPNVAAPLAAVPPLGTYWERVFTHTTSGNCGIKQSELPILRVVESCTDKPTGEIVGWAAQYATATTAT
ncbi:MAG: hypothetical protein ACYDHZ_11870, partial [Dehalococcoidia bacterium]